MKAQGQFVGKPCGTVRWWQVACFLALAASPIAANAQATPQAPQGQNESAIALAPDPGPDPMIIEDSPKRIMDIVPNFQTTNGSPDTQPALTVGQKFMLATDNSFDISAHLGNLFQSGIQQAVNGQPNYGQGWGAFAKRFGASEADQIDGSYMTYAIFPVIFHEDPRYFRLGHGSPGKRIWYALNRSLITRRDSGGWTLNKSQIVGQFVACEISTTYYARQDRNFHQVTLNWVVDLGYKAGYNLLSEYYPDLLAALHHHSKAGYLSTPAPTTVSASLQP